MKKLLLFLLLSLPLNAQWQNSVFLGIGNYSGLGYTSPTYTVGTEIKYELNQFSFSFDVDWSPNRKSSEEYGWSGTSHVSALYLFPETPVLAGGCVGYSYTKAPLWSKSSFRPCVIAGLEQSFSKDFNAFLTAKHFFSGTDRINELTGEEFELRLTYHPFKTYISFKGNLYRFLDSNDHSKSYARSTYGVFFGKQF